MYTHLLLRAGELFLKGQNQRYFERVLEANLRAQTGIREILRGRGRWFVPYNEEYVPLLHRVFGLTSYSPAVKVETELSVIQQTALEMLRDMKGTFKVEAKRSDKRFPLPSPEINRQVGQYIEKNSTRRCDLIAPDHTLFVEINQEGTFLFMEEFPGSGGLPTGTEGKVFLLMENKASVLAGLLMMKRGCEIQPVSFKQQADLSGLQKYSPFRLKLRIVHQLSELEGKDMVLVSGQQLPTIKEYSTSLTVLWPLIAYSEQEIGEELISFLGSENIKTEPAGAMKR